MYYICNTCFIYVCIIIYICPYLFLFPKTSIKRENDFFFKISTHSLKNARECQ